jgi:hypothetical protein
MSWATWLLSVSTGWIVGLVAWIAVGFQAVSCFLFGLPTSLKLWRRGLLTSWYPIVKYTITGVLFSVIGYFLVEWIWGMWNEAFDTALLAGALMGFLISLGNFRGAANWRDFLETNQAYLNHEKATELLTEEENSFL